MCVETVWRSTIHLVKVSVCGVGGGTVWADNCSRNSIQQTGNCRSVPSDILIDLKDDIGDSGGVWCSYYLLLEFGARKVSNPPREMSVFLCASLNNGNWLAKSWSGVHKPRGR